MIHEEAKELHDLLFGFLEMVHEKFLYRLRKDKVGSPRLKKNHGMIISILYQHNGLTSTKLAKMLDIEKGSLTTLIDQLEQLGLVRRCNDLHDRRKALISLTEDGKTEMNQIMERHTQCMNVVFRDVDSDEMNKFVDSLKYVVEFMKKM